MGAPGKMKDGKNGPPGHPFARRVESLRGSMAKEGIGAFVLFCLEGRNWENVFYLTGFRGSHSAFLVNPERAVIVTDGRYMRQAVSQTRVEIVEQGPEGLLKTVSSLLSQWGTRKAELENSRVPYALALSLFESARIEWADGSSRIENMRRVKDQVESDLIAEAGRISGIALEQTLPLIRPGITEREIAARLEYAVRMNGAEGGWGDHEFIVASGLRSSLPHGTPTNKVIAEGEWVTIDYGSRLGGYLCDVTRNVAVGSVPGSAHRIHRLLEEAQEEAFKSVRPGAKSRDIDRAARDVIEGAGFGEAFNHGLGHGLGLELHEKPRVSRYSDDILEAGNVITIEPGIYLEGFGGFRVEDDCLVTDEGAMWLTKTVPSGLLQAG
mgnify:CR=1